MNMTNLSFDLTRLRQGYRSGDFSPMDVVKEALRRISESDPAIWIAVDSEKNLLEQAETLATRSIEDLPLYGIPFAVKDNIDVSNLPTTAACPDYRYFPRQDATVVALLRAAGAIPIGKTNLDQFATGLVGIRSPYGYPKNPFDENAIPGGSSSGSAVAVARGQASFSLGTDTTGSGRVPACFNNLIGLKPSRGLIGNTGVVPACKSLDCVSVFALNASDAQAVFRIAAQFDSSDAYSRPLPNILDTSSRVMRKETKCGVPDPAQLEFFGDQSYMNAYLDFVSRLETLGFETTIVDISPLISASKLLYEGPWVAERFWAIQEILKSSPESLHPITRAIIEKGDRTNAPQTFAALYELQELKAASAAIWSAAQFLALPTVGRHYTATEVESDPIRTNSNLGYYTNFVNLLDLSAVAVPTAMTAKNAPFGITVLAPAFHDEMLLQVADRIHRDSGLPLGATSNRHFPPLEPVEFASESIAVCGPQLEGMPLNHELADLGATLRASTRTAPSYRFYALANASPSSPGLARDEANGVSIEVEVWNLPTTQWSDFISKVPSPLCIGNVELENGSYVKGILCEASALNDAQDISEFGGWRAYIARKG